MRVYRVENDQGEGAYRSATDWSEYADGCRDDPFRTEDGGDRQPTPYGDAGLESWWRSADYSVRMRYYCAFASYEMLLAWWPCEEVRKGMERVGLRLAIYEVPDEDVQLGHRQVMFKRERATLVSRESLVAIPMAA